MRASAGTGASDGRNRTGRRIVAAVTGLIVATGLLAACGSDDGPDNAVDALLTGWPTGDLAAVGFVDPAGRKIPAADVATQIKHLSGDLAATPPTLKRTGRAEVTDDVAIATVNVDWALPGGTRWSYPTQVRLTRGSDDAWQVIWEPKVVQEQLTDGDQLSVSRLPAPRGAILDGAGQPVFAARPVVTVGVQPSEVDDAAALVRELDAAFKAIRPAIPAIDLGGLPDRLAQAKPDAFVEVVTLRREAYDQIRSRIRELPGTKFEESTRDLAPTRDFARALLGTVDPVTKEDMEREPEVYALGDQVGHGGLQGRYEARLRGTVGTNVTIVRKGPDGVVTTTGTEVFRGEPKPGEPIRTTIDVRTQNAADAALAGESRRAALVAVRVSDGAVLAAANGPGGGQENLAFTAQVPPGSGFKMVSALGLLDAGAVTLDQVVACPRNTTVDGRTFKNSDNFELGPVPFRVDFARSCNTAFADLAPQLGPDGLAAAGRTLGLEGTWDLGIDAFSGKVSTGGSGAERAAAAFGQGTTLVSPLAMASATAAVVRGQWQQPTLLLDPAPAAPAQPGPQLKPTSVEPLRTMMREVVTDGTAGALRNLPGGPVHGKTGTAEYDDNPANTHAWFIGWQGDVAFAVFVEKGGSSSASAVPLTERFLRGLAGS
ncbi:penicillin-binding transpeptidase domain-containing protein [Polymorphospora rubra]|uniref:penicillin-binding transpeptidase domain-containing protein n=1 Tax=Polymorphospora rubra TaxID=338584 RepID=UPI0033FB6CE7